MTVASDEASGRSAAAAPVSARSCSWSPPPLLATTKAWLTSVTGCSQPERKKWSFVSRSPENSSSASTQKHATRVPNTPMQLDKPDSRSPGSRRAIRPLPASGERLRRRVRVFISPSLPRGDDLDLVAALQHRLGPAAFRQHVVIHGDREMRAFVVELG